ncbi:MAG: threonine/serine exporter family protein [Caldilineales bacterium]
MIGSALGSSIVNALWPVSAPATQSNYSLGLIYLSVVFLMLGLSLIFQVRPRDLGWVILAGVVAYAGVLLGQQFGNWQGSFIGAFGLGLYTSLVSHRFRIPGSVVMLPGIMILVPGVAAYLGVNIGQIDSIFSTLPAAWGVVLQILAIIGGLYVAASIVPQKTATL